MMANLQSLPHQPGRQCPAHLERPEIILIVHLDAQSPSRRRIERGLFCRSSA